MNASRPVARVTIDGMPLTVPSGITVAAALTCTEAITCRTSVSGELRGPLCGMGTCYECRVTVDGIPHRRACMTAVQDGMRIERCT